MDAHRICISALFFLFLFLTNIFYLLFFFTPSNVNYDNLSHSPLVLSINYTTNFKTNNTNITSSPYEFFSSSPENITSLLHEISSSPTNITFSLHEFVSSPENISSGDNFKAHYTNKTPSPHEFFSPPTNISYNNMVHSRNKNIDGKLLRIEKDLAEARMAIMKAIRHRNFTSDREESFIPRGRVYRNSYAFHQSHIEMLKRFKVWTYKEGEQPLFHSGPQRSIYAIEGHVMNELESGESPFKARHPDEAHIFMLPISVVNIVRFLYNPLVTYARDQLMRTVVDYTDIISHKYPYWNRSKGADHFLASCHDWAPGISRLKQGKELYKHLIRVLCNANTSEGFEPVKDVSLPEIHVRGFELNSPMVSQHPQKRSILAFFAGGVHGRIRQILLEQWKGKDKEVQVHEYLPKRLNYHKLMGKSKFCLCPSGYEVASPRLVESINAGCVPVIISDYYELPFSDVLDWTKFSIFIPPKNISEIKTLLKGVSQARYMKLYKMVIGVRRHFQLNRPAKPFDVLHMIFHSVWLRRLNVKISH